MATGGGENLNPAYEAFRKHSADLLMVIQDPEVLAWELFSESVVSSAMVEFANNMMHERGEKTSKLLMAVGSQIVEDPRVFDVFLSVLSKRPPMSDLCKRMKEMYDSILTSEQLQSCPQHITHQPEPSSGPPITATPIYTSVSASSSLPPPPAKRPRTDILQSQHSLEHTVQSFDLKHNYQAPVLQYPHAQFLQYSPPLPTSDQHTQHPPSNFCHPTLVGANQSRTDIMQPQHPLEHTIQQFDFQHKYQTPMLQYPHTQFLPSASPYNSGEQFSAVGTYASYLKSVYAKKKLLLYDRWPQVKSKKYINLALIEKEDITKQEADQFTRATIHGNIDDIKKSKRATNIDQIAQLPDGSQLKCILVEGAPGVGKSTFAWKLCHKWGKGKLLQQYQLVVLLRLRDKSVRAAKNISNLFQYYQQHIQQAVVEEIQITGGKGVFLLFEGYDELPEESRRESSVFLDVITGRELPEAAVLITSRPWASEFLHRECKEHISQHIEILGFTKDNIQSYLESTIPNDPSLLADLKKYISCYPHINSMMYIPLNSAIVVEVYRNSRKDETLVPKTMTELYSSLVRSLLLRHLLDHPVHGKKRRWRVRIFSDLPQDVYQQLCELGRIAYEGILHDQQVIFCDLPEDVETLGLMQCSPELYADEGAAVSYNFLHLTVQEYLAAFHLSQQPVEKQIEHFREYQENNFGNGSASEASDKSDVESCSDFNSDVEFDMGETEYTYHKQHHFHMVLRFLCGLRKFSEYPCEALNTLCAEKSGDDSASVVREVTFDTLHWLFEAQDNDIIAKVFESSDIQLDSLNSDGGATPFDCFVLGYCVSHSNCTWKIVLQYCNIGDEGVELLVRGAVEEVTHCTGGFSEIDLSENDITSEGVKHLWSFPKQLISKLKTLNLSANKLDSAPLVHLPHLKKLNLSGNPNISQGGAVLLMISVIAHDSLEELWLYKTGIGVKDCRGLSEILLSSTSLKMLNISHNHLPLEAVELIISGLHHNATLEKLEMCDSQFSLQSTISLASVLRTNHTLVNLCLKNCNIGSDGACWLASALCTNDTLQMYMGGENLIGVKGVTAFAEMLLKNKSLKTLSLVDDSIGEEGTQKLIDSLTHNATVEMLVLPEKYKSTITISSVDSNRVRFVGIATRQ